MPKTQKNKMYNFLDIPQFTRQANYQIHVGWDYLEDHIEHEQEKRDGLAALALDPDFQRAHVWSEEQQRRYVEFVLRGGRSSKDLYFNCVGWMGSYEGPYVLVDGKQRLEAVRKFMRGDLTIFHDGLIGNDKPVSVNDFSNKILRSDAAFVWHVNNLKTRAEVLQWYLDINSGGVVHTEEELSKVRRMLMDLRDQSYLINEDD